MSLLRPNLFPVFSSISKVIYIREDLTMLRRSLFVSALLLVGTLGFASSAKAQVQPTGGTVQFNATVDPSCTLTPTATPGNLALNGANTLSSLSGGTGVTLAVNCPTGILRVQTPVRTNAGVLGAGTNTTTNKARIILNGGTTVYSAAADGQTQFILTPAENGDATVHMEASDSAALAAGTYNYSVTVTAGPS
jgi:hypothetical protein